MDEMEGPPKSCIKNFQALVSNLKKKKAFCDTSLLPE